MARYLFLSFLCALLWGSTGILVRLIQNLATPDIIFFRLMVAYVFFVIVFMLPRKRGNNMISDTNNRLFKDILLSSAMTGYYLLATVSFLYAPVALAALIIALSPSITLVCRIFFRDRIRFSETLGFLISFIGITIFLFSLHGFSVDFSNEDLVIGSGLALGAAALRAVFSFAIWQKNQRGEVTNLLRLNHFTFLIGIIVLFPITIIGFDVSQLTLADALYLILLGLMATAFPNGLNAFVSTALKPMAHSMIGMTTPIVASVLAWILLNESIPATAILAMAISIFGIAFSVRSGAR